MPSALYPLRFREILRNYTFGDRWITRAFTKTGLPENHRIAETWEVCDRPGESSPVTNGPLAGATLHELIERDPERLLGSRTVRRMGTRFPLLIKFLDCSSSLAEQAHHSDALARDRGLADPGKTEAWYMLRTKPGTTIHCGNRPGVTPDKLRESILEGRSKECMQVHAVQPSDAFLLYAGTMHYSAGGQLFYEIMQNSDVYIGLDKPDTSLPEAERVKTVNLALEGVHLEEGFDCRIRPVVVDDPGARRTFVLACEQFALERFDLDGACDLVLDGSNFCVLSQVEGSSAVHWHDMVETLGPGASCLLPASLGAVRVSGTKGSSVLKAYVPDLNIDIIEPLRKRGIPDGAIVGLGGKTRLNPLGDLMTRRL